MNGEREQLRERVAAAIGKVRWREWDAPSVTVPSGATPRYKTRTYPSDEQVADAVLDTLGLVQVGWWSPRDGHFWLGTHGVRGVEAVPVYRLKEEE